MQLTPRERQAEEHRAWWFDDLRCEMHTRLVNRDDTRMGTVTSFAPLTVRLGGYSHLELAEIPSRLSARGRLNVVQRSPSIADSVQPAQRHGRTVGGQGFWAEARETSNPHDGQTVNPSSTSLPHRGHSRWLGRLTSHTRLRTTNPKNQVTPRPAPMPRPRIPLTSQISASRLKTASAQVAFRHRGGNPLCRDTV